jgi:hypothetical protein
MPSFKSAGLGGEFNFLKRCGLSIQFTHLSSGLTATFLGAIGDLKDNYASTWQEEPVYGRMDPISTFQRTGRKISLSWEILNESVKIGRENMQEVQKLINFLYPDYYSETNNASTISAGPVLKLRFANLINDVNERQGLVGYLAGFTFDPVMDAGFVKTNSSEMIPKLLNASVEFTVLHTHKLGWHHGAPRVDRFPYNKNFLADNDAAAVAANLRAGAEAEARGKLADQIQDRNATLGQSAAATQRGITVLEEQARAEDERRRLENEKEVVEEAEKDQLQAHNARMEQELDSTPDDDSEDGVKR